MREANDCLTGSGPEPGTPGCDYPLGTLGGPSCGKVSLDPNYYRAKQAQECVSRQYANPHHLIDQEIQYHNEQATNLNRLRHCLPGEMNREAEQALCDLIFAARSRR